MIGWTTAIVGCMYCICISGWHGRYKLAPNTKMLVTVDCCNYISGAGGACGLRGEGEIALYFGGRVFF